MRFQAEHRFAASVRAVGELLADPSFYLGLELPDLALPELLDQRTERSDSGPEVVVLRLRYEFTGSLDPIAERLLGSSRLAWVQEVRVERSSGTGRLGFEAERDPRRLHGSADFVLEATGSGCVRRLEGELVVAVPAIGPMAERRIVPGLLRRLDIEAEALSARLGQSGA